LCPHSSQEEKYLSQKIMEISLSLSLKLISLKTKFLKQNLDFDALLIILFDKNKNFALLVLPVER
jgi:hypothetical protein